MCKKSKLFSVLSMFIILLLLFGNISAVAITENMANSNAYILNESELLAAVQPLIDAQSEFYNIVKEDISNIVRTVNDDRTITTTFDLTLSMALKAKSISELPYVKGMLGEIGIATVEESTAKAIESKLSNDISVVSTDISKFFKKNEHDISMVSKAMAEVISTLDTEISPNAIISPAYKRVSARDYANQWTSTVTSYPYIDETKYNPAYESKNSIGGDCANYIS